MQAQKLPALRGWTWLVAGVRLWRQSPLALTGAATFMTLGLLLLLTFPLFGQIAFPLLLPALGVGMFLLCMAVRAGRPAPPALLFGAFGPRLPALLALGALRMAYGMIAAMLAMQLAGLDLSMAQVDTGSLGDEPGVVVRMPEGTSQFMVWLLVISLPMEMASWFAAPLIALRRQALFKSMFFSFVACLRNLGAFVVYMLSFSLCMMILPITVALQLGQLFPTLGSLLLAPVVMLAVPIFFTGFYCCAEDIFGNWE
ncbi:MAG: hypothetical protein CGU28_00445 [Candidatus Dactylopiibacterium carminicum]|uniref:Uncharacterized protein n=1 Tax=Candidatus Dactylopiibacterium carminicum TaxID=857335 RepID=A0A272EYX8_9RHOO|nr:BPSS1780 family membrane protein [Candidatus Dactylopiibacterium carminicum]KAF7600835.1 hypothetical protein BGI27_00330 [Candidatus Dactylopiibacterium carminicum]PAS95334.1 MAG: hypothetical protein CGU29_00365 [Candidatus Dactylopiibacterium carminicum]PAS98654.1 MAG: hypothetical protein CGU28_00445 [Candidatus Dactylopiibacterium carminicum]PAT00839.1 MAG: hypothetical protein BSR46_00330 [Candidatus Dactylopiibacterium carminicum]